ncbi:MAG: hypothetical protein A2X36_12730 [Elusimicrobia bacterium GWA2_69_24]|nr:MAG: hypothetical protein A2X36_12730 [Elusimicrobia bacterium GWA2_69_24]HBL17461.1 hypothetical protein [Elusimicrobiota bacterium]
MRALLAAGLFFLSAATCDAGSVRVIAFDDDGRLLDTAGLLRYISPAAFSRAGIGPDKSGLFVSDLDGRAAGGRPWWVARSTMPVWAWADAERVRFSLPWPVQKDGFSTALLDARGEGYADDQELLLNEEIAVAAYRRLQESLKERIAEWTPAYAPTKPTTALLERVKKLLADAHAANVRRDRARLFDEALTQIAFAGEQILFEHGHQTVRDPKRGPQLRWGLTLDETVVDNAKEFDWLAKTAAGAGVNWVRLVFRLNGEDFTFAKEKSFSHYDALVAALQRNKIKVMGSILDSMLWPKGVNADLYRERTNNLVFHFKDRIPSWEVASEPNGDWHGGTLTPVDEETKLLCIQRAVIEVKRIDPALETVATLHWWEGTASDDRHGLFQWLRWSMPRGFGKGLDVVALSVYPHRHPVGLAFDPAFRELRTLFPGARLMLGGWSFVEEDKLEGYWWLKPGNVGESRKDLLVFFTGAAAAVPDSLGGGFFWPTFPQMLNIEKRKTTALFKIYEKTVERLRAP